MVEDGGRKKLDPAEKLFVDIVGIDETDLKYMANNWFYYTGDIPVANFHGDIEDRPHARLSKHKVGGNYTLTVREHKPGKRKGTDVEISIRKRGSEGISKAEKEALSRYLFV